MEMTKKREEMNKRIVKHGELLKEIFYLPAYTDPTRLYKKLRRLENKGRKISTQQCNAEIDEDTFDDEKAKIKQKLRAILGDLWIGAPLKYCLKNPRHPHDLALFFNSDPRGYALKFNDEWVREKGYPIYTDMGGFGIIAPDFS